MALDFPSTPTNGQTFTSGSRTWTYNSSRSSWESRTLIAGAGDVIGPASSTDNTIARFDGTTGKFVQGSSVIIDDSSNVGIGTTPTEKLDVLGNIKWTGSTNENVYVITDGASVDLDPDNGTIQIWTLEASRSPTLTNFSAGQSVTLMIEDGLAYTITWPANINWVGGSAPTLSTTGSTVIQLWKAPGSLTYPSTSVFGALVGTI